MLIHLGLCRFAEEQIKFEKNYEPVFQENDLLWVCVFNQLHHYTADSPSITVNTPFYVYTLLHWKILSQLISLSENKENLVSFEQPKYIQSYTFVPPHISLVDSHFHLDILSKISGDDTLPPYQWRWGGIDYSISHLITNYCYPRNWPSSKIRSRVREDPRIKFTYGIHPRIVTLERTSTLNNWIDDLDHRLNTTKVVAVGECELESTDLKTDINKQLEYFEKQIVLAVKKNLPLVIHCRGDKRLDEQCLNSLTCILPRDFKIHRHCFNGKPDTYNKWKVAFANWKLECLRLFY